MLDPPVGESARPAPTLEALLKEWGITLGHDVVIDISGMGQLLGTDASVPVVASYPPHPVTENFKLLTAFPLAQSVKGEAGVELGTANTAERASNERTELVRVGREVARRRAARSRWTRSRAISAARSRSRCRCRWTRRTRRLRRLRRFGDKPAEGEKPARGARSTAKAADAHHRRRRLRLRIERRLRHSGQRRPVRQHEQLADAAGRSHLDPSARCRRSAHDDDGRSAAACCGCRCCSSPASSSARASTPGGRGGNGTHWLDADPARCRTRSRRLSVLRRIEAARSTTRTPRKRSSRTRPPRSISSRSNPAAAR